MSEYMPEDMPDRMPEDMSDRMPEDMPEHMPEDMPDRMPNRMSEDMSGRMPEDLPVRKCINVMVGITRSKVIIIFKTIYANNLQNIQRVGLGCSVSPGTWWFLTFDHLYKIEIPNQQLSFVTGVWPQHFTPGTLILIL